MSGLSSVERASARAPQGEPALEAELRALEASVLEHAGAWDRARGVDSEARARFERLCAEGHARRAFQALGRGQSLGALLALATPAFAREVATACRLPAVSGLTASAPWFSAPRLAIEWDGDDCRLSGECAAVVEGQAREQLLVRVGDGRFALVPLRARAEGVEVRALSSDAAGCAALASVRFTRVRLGASAFGQLRDGELELLRSRHSLWLAHALCGLADALFDDTLRFVGKRGFRTGKLSDLAVVRHRLADIGLHPQLMAQQLAAAEAPGELQGLRCLLLAETLSEHLPQFIKQCQQLHGGRGFLSEFRVARAYRDCLHLAWLLGSRRELRTGISARIEQAERLHSLTGSFGTPEHAAFRRQVGELVEAHVSRPKTPWEEDSLAVAGLHAVFARANVTTVRLGPSAGGPGRDFSYSVILAEELTARGCAGVGISLMIAAGAVVPLLAREASSELRAQLWPRLTQGKAVLSFGITEPDGGSDLLHSLRTTARLDGEHWVMNGRKMFITNGPIADYVLVLARTSDRGGPFHSSFIAVPTATPGVVVSKPYDTLGLRASPTGYVEFHDARVPKYCLIGREGLGMHYLADSISEERTLIAVGALTLAWTLVCDALARSAQHAGRRAGEGPGSERLLSWLARLDAMLCLASDTAQTVVRGERDYVRAGLLKFAGCEATQEALECAAEVIGQFSDLAGEPTYTRALRDARVFTVFAGTTETLRELVGASIAARARLASKVTQHD